MKKMWLCLLICMSMSLSANYEKHVRITQGLHKGQDGYIVGSMTINLNLESDELVDLLLDGIDQEYRITEQQAHELKHAIEKCIEVKNPKPSFYFVHKNKKCFGVFDVQSFEEIR